MGTRERLALVLCAGLIQVACSGDDSTKNPPVDQNPDPVEGDGETGEDGAADDGSDDQDGEPGQDGAVGDGSADGDVGDGSTGPCGGGCAEGEVCNEQTDTCEPAPDACPCDDGEHCDSATNTCAPGCVGDEDCANGQTCDAATGTCEAQPGCPGTAVAGLTVTRIAVNQAVDIPVVEGGDAVASSSRDAPIVQGRDALFRISVEPGAGYTPTDVTTELTLDNGGQLTKFTTHGVINEASDESTLAGTINVRVDGAAIGPDTRVRVAFTQDQCVTATGESTFPDDGSSLALAAEKTGLLKVVIVPYERAPYKLVTTPEVIERVRKGLYAYYPVEDVEVTVRSEAVPVMNPQTDLSRVLQHIRGLRAQDNPPDDVFYFGFFTAANTLREFCGMGCVAGIATLGGNGRYGSPEDRYGVGIGYLTDTETTSQGMPTTDIEVSINVMAHELGHAHGRRHSPCGDAAGPDPNFPNDTADVDAYGYNLDSEMFATPGVHKDLMGYCEPQWIHSYTYDALATRVTGIYQESGFVRKGPPVEYASVIVHDDGRASWGDNVTLRMPPSGRKVIARALDATGAVVDANVAVTLDGLADLDATLVTLPVPGHDWAAVEIEGHRIDVQ